MHIYVIILHDPYYIDYILHSFWLCDDLSLGLCSI